MSKGFATFRNRAGPFASCTIMLAEAGEKWLSVPNTKSNVGVEAGAATMTPEWSASEKLRAWRDNFRLAPECQGRH